MDAGSSKTNTIVYKWRSNKYKGTGRVSQEGNCYAKGKIILLKYYKILFIKINFCKGIKVFFFTFF